MTLTRPLLMNDHKLKDGLVINGRVDSNDSCEIYSLKNEKGYLYLFKNLNKGEVVNSRERYDIIYVNTMEGEKVGVVNEDYSRAIQEKIRKEITELIGLESVAGMKELKELLVNEVINPLRNPEKYKKFKIGIPNGILLYGPPGCGKTYTVTKLAEELGYNYIYVRGSDVSSPYIHGGVEKISRLFDKAKSMAPTVLFFDDFEALVPDRDRLFGEGSHKQEEINQFLQEMNNSSDNNILVVGATNKPEIIDSAILRSGRFDKRILIPAPDSDARKEVIKLYLMNRPVSAKIDYDKLAALTENYVTSDIELIIEDSARLAVKRDLPEITQDLIEECINKTIPSISSDEMKYFESIKSSYDRV